MKLFNTFWVGGFLCLIAQVLIDKTKMTPARIMVSYVVAGVVLTALGIYDKIVDYAGCGATTPIIGFGYTLAKGVVKAVGEKGILGALTGGVTGAAAGITAAVVFGFVFALFCKAKGKKPTNKSGT